MYAYIDSKTQNLSFVFPGVYIFGGIKVVMDKYKYDKYVTRGMGVIWGVEWYGYLKGIVQGEVTISKNVSGVGVISSTKNHWVNSWPRSVNTC